MVFSPLRTISVQFLCKQKCNPELQAKSHCKYMQLYGKVNHKKLKT